MSEQYTFKVIGVVESCFTENFGIPRQPGLVPAARGTIRLRPPYDQPEAVRGLEGFSHLWVIFVFHQLKGETDKSTVRPPRLGGNSRLGVFASRATHRPNPVGLSLVRLEGIQLEAGRVVLDVSGLDLLNGTPVLDIKPYLPYAEAVSSASAGYAEVAPRQVEVQFTEQARQQAVALERRYPAFAELLTQVLGQDPRPAFHRQSERHRQRIYGLTLYDQNVRWRIREDQTIEVLDISPLQESS